jgi:hypothetical protein
MEKEFNVKDWGTIPAYPTAPSWAGKTYDHNDPLETIPREGYESGIEIEGYSAADPLHYSILNRPLIQLVDNDIASDLKTSSIIDKLDGTVFNGFDFVSESGGILYFSRGAYSINGKYIDLRYYIDNGKKIQISGVISPDLISFPSESVIFLVGDELGNISLSTDSLIESGNEQIIIGRFDTDLNGDYVSDSYRKEGVNIDNLSVHEIYGNSPINIKNDLNLNNNDALNSNTVELNSIKAKTSEVGLVPILTSNNSSPIGEASLEAYGSETPPEIAYVIFDSNIATYIYSTVWVSSIFSFSEPRRIKRIFVYASATGVQGSPTPPQSLIDLLGSNDGVNWIQIKNLGSETNSPTTNLQVNGFFDIDETYLKYKVNVRNEFSSAAGNVFIREVQFYEENPIISLSNLDINGKKIVNCSVLDMNEGTIVNCSNIYRRNLFINGDFLIWQRGNNGGGGFFADRWKFQGDNCSVSVTKSEGYSSDLVRKTYADFGLSGGNTIGGYGFKISQQIEGAIYFYNKKKYLSFSGGATGGDNVSPYSVTVSIPGSSYTQTIMLNGNSYAEIPAFSNAANPSFLPSDPKMLVEITFTVAPGGIGGGGITVYNLQLTLEKGVVDRRSFAEELELCQRYYEKSYNLTEAPASTGTFSSELKTVYHASSFVGKKLDKVSFKTRKARVPDITIYSPVTGQPGKADVSFSSGGAGDKTVSLVSSSEQGTPSETGFSIVNTSGENWGFSGPSTYSGADVSFHWVANAEIF